MLNITETAAVPCRETAPARPHIIFGNGVRSALGVLVNQAAARAKVGIVTTMGSLKAAGVEAEIISLLGEAGALKGLWRVPSHPHVEDCFRIAEDVSRVRPDVLVALGGGSALDAGKIAAACSDFMAASGSDSSARPEPLSFASVSAAAARPRSSTYLVAIPTTAGSGSEVTATATAWLEKSKSSFKGPALLPDLAVVDPELCSSLPPRQVIACGMDALSHAVDSICSRRSTPATLSLARAAVVHLTSALLKTCEAGASDGKAAADFSQQSMGSLLAGLVISQTGTTLIHSLSYSLTLEYGMEHGLACGMIADTLLNGKSALSLELYERVSSTLGSALADEVLRTYRVGAATLMGTTTLCDYLAEDRLAAFVRVAEKSGRLQEFYREITEANLREICPAPPRRDSVGA